MTLQNYLHSFTYLIISAIKIRQNTIYDAMWGILGTISGLNFDIFFVVFISLASRSQYDAGKATLYNNVALEYSSS